jgi:ribosomal protein S18 acetylase RimI-like enzyme
MDVVIAAAHPDDAGELLTVQRAAYLVEAQRYDDPHIAPLTETLDEVRAAIAGDPLVLVARTPTPRGDRLVGSVRGSVIDGTGRVARLAVAPDLHGHGIGRRLLAAVEAALAPRVTRFELFTGAHSDGNLHLYRTAGYVDLGHRPTPEGPGLTYLEKRV